MATEGSVPSQLGAVALVGSGEYTDAMNETDRHLIDTLGGLAATRVALLPTASGLEPGSPKYWNDLGMRHFTSLGVADVRSTWILDTQTAHDPAQLDLLRGANFYYFSGGNPQHLISSMRGTPAWEIIAAAYANGAVLAGCSAGAMAMSGYTLSLRFAFSGSGPVEFVESLAVVPHVIVFPHFDRILGRMSRAALRTRLVKAPQGAIPIGVDEDTALVRIALPNPANPDGKAQWRVTGRQTVTIFWPDAAPQVLHTGDEVAL
ncbi:MAG: Type 1 glutamine amidotransferase-like domain-containing protein [Ktedonobacterales bacterium]